MVIKRVSYVFVGGMAISFHHYLMVFGYDYSLMINCLEMWCNISTRLPGR
jgi:hypothetical protein